MHASFDGGPLLLVTESTVSRCRSLTPLVDGVHIDVQDDYAGDLDGIANQHPAYMSVSTEEDCKNGTHAM